MNLIQKQEAKRLGLRRYFTGKPCKRGHVAERWTTTGICIACSREHGRARLLHPAYQEQNRKRAREWGRANSHRAVVRVAAWRAANPGKRKAKDAEYRARNRDQCRQRNAVWRAKRPTYFRDYQAEHVETYRAHRRNSKARRKAAPGMQRTSRRYELPKATVAPIAQHRSMAKGTSITSYRSRSGERMTPTICNCFARPVTLRCVGWSPAKPLISANVQA